MRVTSLLVAAAFFGTPALAQDIGLIKVAA